MASIVVDHAQCEQLQGFDLAATVRRVIYSLVLLTFLVGARPAAAAMAEDCFSEDNERRILGCSELIQTPNIDASQLSLAYAMRALAYSIKGMFDLALPDYDSAIRMNPDFAIALNNRAWTYFKLGKPEKGLSDVERSLELSPGSSHALDTRAHIHHLLGNATQALRDYRLAMRYGGERIIKLYQCGLQIEGLYAGDIDGRLSAPLNQALEACVANRKCDPLPAEEECRNATS